MIRQACAPLARQGSAIGSNGPVSARPRSGRNNIPRRLSRSPVSRLLSPWSDRRGFALLAALWLCVALTIVAATSLAIGHVGLSTTQNRLALTRGTWAAEACHAILDARYAADQHTRSVDTTDVGNGVWCTAELSEPATRLNLNLAAPAQLAVLLGADSLVDALLDWCDPDTLPRPNGAERGWYLARGRQPPRDGPLSDPRELLLVKGFDSATVAHLLSLVTTLGDGRVDLNSASSQVLATVPGLGTEALGTIAYRRSAGRPLESIDALAGALSPAGRAQLSESWAALQQSVVTSPTLFAGHFHGGVRGLPVSAEVVELLVPDGARLAVVRRVMP